jgi:chemotaxis protein MotC
VRKICCSLLLITTYLVNPCNLWASGGSRLQFRDTTRTLERMQDATASGDYSAVEMQSKLIIQMETDLKTAKQADLQDDRNLRAIAVYLFSGGNPDIAENRLAPLKIDPEKKALLDGALAYARGDKANAIKFLADIDVASLPANLAGRVALVKAILTSAEDLKSALLLLSTARSFMPGTLVEEAALRRCISFAGKLPNIEQLEHCASLYIRRFPKSVYWREFEENFTLSMIEVDYLKSGGSMQQLILVLKDLPSSDYRRMLLKISKAALNHGRYSLATLNAEKALELSRADSAEMARSNLYLGAIMIVQKNLANGKEKLEQLDKQQLDQSDQVLLEKALDLARQIARTPDLTAEQAVKSQSPDDLSENQSPAYASLLTRAKKALADPIN